jgi:hypothetical protein
MGNRSRGLRESVVRGLAKAGLVWAVFVLGALFMTMSAQGQPDGDALPSADAPRPAGLVLALVLLVGGATVLALGAVGGERRTDAVLEDAEPGLPYAAERAGAAPPTALDPVA